MNKPVARLDYKGFPLEKPRPTRPADLRLIWGFNVSTLFTYTLEHHRMKKELKSPAGSFQHPLTAASKTQRGTDEKKPSTILFSFFFLAELQLILMRRPNMTSWKESRRNLAALATRAAEGGPSSPISFSACLSADINIPIPLPTYENKSKNEWNACTQTSLRADWRRMLFFNSVIETFLSAL